MQESLEESRLVVDIAQAEFPEFRGGSKEWIP